MSAEKRKELSIKAASLVDLAYKTGWTDGINHVTGAVSKGITPMNLLERFIELYGEVPLEGSMVEPGYQLWHDYYGFSGDHMVLTDEGWEPGEVKQSYLDVDPDAILDEVNAPQKGK